MKCLISSGSFKDVYTSAEACRTIRDILPTGYDAVTLPVCDGGDYTYSILKDFFGGKAREIIVPDVFNPYGAKVTSHYLAVDGTAWVVSSEILHLTPEEDSYKNPLYLSDYGLGQLIAHAAAEGFRDIRL